ncbi:MAG: glycoside hydrolase family 3 N-terminal domain-containing protein [Bacteroidales bacterium]
MRKSFKVVVIFILLFSNSLFAVTPTLLSGFQQKKEQKQWVDSVISTMTLDEQIGQLFMITADVSLAKNNVEKLTSYIENQKIGGLLFAKSTIESQAKLTNLLQSQARIPLFISLDGEWGLSMRIDGTTRFPKNIALGAIKDTHLVYEYGREVALQCKLMGIHINFAPVLDINNNPNNPVINIRSFGENRERVTEAALAYAKGLESEGVISVGKHFPGHGDTSTDSHLGLPTLNLSLKRIDSLELYPFKKYIKSGLSGMMVGHLYLPVFDNDTIPASMSSSVITDLLKNELGFEGLIFTDALVMKAIASKGESVAVKALMAGNDILLNPANPIVEHRAVLQAVLSGVIDSSTIARKCRKVLSYKFISGLNHYQPIDLNSLSNRLNTIASELLNHTLAQQSLTLLKNSENKIPLSHLDLESIAIVSIGDKNTTFQSTSHLYANVVSFSVTESTTVDQFNAVVSALKGFSTVIVGIYSDKAENVTRVNQLLSQMDNRNQLVTSFFVSPYKMSVYKQLVNESKAVLMAYESTPIVQHNAAQLLFGGVEANGHLPVTVDSLFAYQSGLKSEKTRLSYQLPESVGLDSKKLIRIDSIVNDALRAQAIPGCQVLVAKNGSVVYNKNFGYFDYAGTHPVDTYDLYDLASMTKATATVPALMLLYDQNQFLLRDKLERFIPQLKGTDVGDITVKEALYHQSGLPAFIPFYQMLFDSGSYEGSLVSVTQSNKYPMQIDENLYAQKNLSFDKMYVSEKEIPPYRVKVAENFYLNPAYYDIMMKRLIDTKLASKQKYVYSDLNFMLLRMMINNLSQTTIDSLLAKKLYSKLGAFNTGYLPLRKFDRLHIAPTENDHFFRNQLLIGNVDDELAALAGGVEGNAGLFSNANDIAKLCQMLLNKGEYGGEKLINRETVQLFMNAKSPDSRRGLGFDKPNPIKPSNGPTSDLAPLSTVGHTGFTGTCFWIDPENQLIYIFLSNRVYPNRWNKKLSQMDTRTLIQDAIYNAIIQNRK